MVNLKKGDKAPNTAVKSAESEKMDVAVEVEDKTIEKKNEAVAVDQEPVKAASVEVEQPAKRSRRGDKETKAAEPKAAESEAVAEKKSNGRKRKAEEKEPEIGGDDEAKSKKSKHEDAPTSEKMDAESVASSENQSESAKDDKAEEKMEVEVALPEKATEVAQVASEEKDLSSENKAPVKAAAPKRGRGAKASQESEKMETNAPEESIKPAADSDKSSETSETGSTADKKAAPKRGRAVSKASEAEKGKGKAAAEVAESVKPSVIVEEAVEVASTEKTAATEAVSAESAESTSEKSEEVTPAENSEPKNVAESVSEAKESANKEKEAAKKRGKKGKTDETNEKSEEKIEEATSAAQQEAEDKKTEEAKAEEPKGARRGRAAAAKTVAEKQDSKKPEAEEENTNTTDGRRGPKRGAKAQKVEDSEQKTEEEPKTLRRGGRTAQKAAEKQESKETEKKAAKTVAKNTKEVAKKSNKNAKGKTAEEKVHDAEAKGAKKGAKKARDNEDAPEDEPPKKKARVTVVSHSSHRTAAGTVLTVGEGDTGQLGLGPDVQERGRPGEVEMPSGVVQICAGGMHSVCLTVNGEVFTFGCNDEGSLGRTTPEEDDCMVPGKVDLPEKIVLVSAGDSHTAALSTTGQVYIWGTFRDANGSIGIIPGQGKLEKPEKILPGVTVSKIVSGCDHLVCLTTDGDIYSLGAAEQGQLGRVAECFSVRGGRKGIELLLKPAQVKCTKRNQKFVDIWAGQYVSFAKAKDSGDIYAWGLNNYYQLGFADMRNKFIPEKSTSFDKTKDWQEISGGQHHTIALDKDGLVYSLGRKEYGRLGLGSNVEKDAEAPTLVSSLKDKCVNVNCGSCVSFAVTEEGKIYGWGMGSSKQLGQGDDESDIHEPHHITSKLLADKKGLMVSAGGQHTVFLTQNRS